MILIIGAQEEYHSEFMFNKLRTKGEDVLYFDTRELCKNFLGSIYPSEYTPEGNFLLKGKKVFFKEIKSVYWRHHYGVNINPESNSGEDLNTAYLQQREFDSLIDSAFRLIDCLWVNSPNAIKMHKAKGFQLNLMAKNKIRVPRTLITNDRDELESFYKSSASNLIFKPVLGGALTEKITPELLSEERLNSLKNSPVQFQELLEGVDVRVYGVGKQLFSAEIIANSIDFRGDQRAKIVPVEIPTGVKNDCLKIMEIFDLKFTGIDIKHNKNTDEYVFIEANPSPMFTFFEDKTGFPISNLLAEMLTEGKLFNQ